ncbi:MAG: ABC transporter ATP-binding protein [Cyanobacteria bacterium P01_E01_bin.48]
MAGSSFQKLVGYARPYQRDLWLGALALLLVNALGVFLPWYVKVAIDDLSTIVDRLGPSELSGQVGRVTTYAAVIAVVATVMALVRTASRMWMFGVGRQVEFDLKQQIFQHLLTLPPSYFGRQSVGELINRSTSDVENVRRLLGFAVLSMFNTVFAYGLTLPAMLALDLQLTLIALSVYPLMLVLVSLTSERLRRQQMVVQNRLGEMSELIQEDMNGIALIKVYGQEANEQREFAKRNQHLLQANLDLALTRNLLFPTLTALAGTGLLVLLLLGGPRIVAGDITLGDFAAFTLYVERLVFPTALLGFTLTAYQRGQVSIDRLEAILAEDPSIKDAPNAVTLSETRGHIAARNLTFSYPEARHPTLDRVNFEMQAGQTVAIVGPIGSGKSTLANALLHLVEVEPKTLFLDDIDITRIRLHSLRQEIAYVPQESFLFGASIRDNIRYGKPATTHWDVEAAAKAARIHEEILNFPQQYDTIVGERGITLSGGQRQRVALARALLLDAPVLILDDSLSSVDNQTGQDILTNISRSTATKTVVFVSHRLTAAASADRILVLDEGRIVQTGSHRELLQDPDGLYGILWRKQQLENTLVETS